MNKDRHRWISGFTLVEIMVVVIIIGVIASMAIPAYTGNTERIRASEGVSSLTALLSSQKRYQLENSAYATALADLDIDITASNNFNVPTVANNAASVAKIVRTDGSVTLCISDTGVITCSGTAGVCSQYTVGVCP